MELMMVYLFLFPNMGDLTHVGDGNFDISGHFASESA